MICLFQEPRQKPCTVQKSGNKGLGKCQLEAPPFSIQEENFVLLRAKAYAFIYNDGAEVKENWKKNEANRSWKKFQR